MKSTLLCTFAHSINIDLVTDYIKLNYTLPRKSIYIFNNSDKQDELYFTYNVDNVDHTIPNTIMIHRKQHTNTLYTINALNAVIRACNNGVLDQNFELDWFRYENSLLLTDSGRHKVVNLKLYTVKNF